MSNSSIKKISKYRLTYENLQYKITNLSLFIASSIYILAVVILIFTYCVDTNVDTSFDFKFRLLCIFCASVITVDLLFYFMDSTNKNLKYIYTTWYSIFYFIALYTIHNTLLFYSIIFLLIIGILYTNMHHSIYSCSCILLCTVFNSIYKISSKSNEASSIIDNYYTHTLYIFITACIIILITYMFTHLNRTILTIFEEMSSKNEDNLSNIKEQIQVLKKKTRKAKKNIDSTDNIVSFCSKTTTEISNLSRIISKNNRLLSSLSQNLEQNSTSSDKFIKETDKSKEKVSSFINETIKNTTHLENQIMGTTNSLKNATDKIDNLKKQSDKLQMVLKNISSLSSQLNLLSINVSIESVNTDSDEASFKIALEQLRTLTNNIQSTCEKLLDSFSDIEYLTNSIEILFTTAKEEFDDNINLITLMKKQSSLAVSDLDDLSQYINNISYNTEQINATSNELFTATSNITPEITHIRSHTIENSTSIQKVYESLKNNKGLINDLLETIAEINNNITSK